MADERYEWLDKNTAERLLRGEPVGPVGDQARAQADRLSAALDGIARAGGPEAGELPGEAAALAAFRKARAASPEALPGIRIGSSAASVRPGRRGGAPVRWGRPVRIGLAGALAGVALGGVAVAAGTGVLPSPFGRSSDPTPASSVSAAATPDPLLSGSPTGEPSGPGASTPGTGTPSAPGETPDDGYPGSGDGTDQSAPGTDGGTSTTDPGSGDGATGDPAAGTDGGAGSDDLYRRTVKACQETATAAARAVTAAAATETATAAVETTTAAGAAAATAPPAPREAAPSRRSPTPSRRPRRSPPPPPRRLRRNPADLRLSDSFRTSPAPV